MNHGTGTLQLLMRASYYNSVMDNKFKDRSIDYIKKHPEATVRQITKAAGMKSMSIFYSIFPGGLKDLCKLADISFDATRKKRIEKATDARTSPPIEVRHDIPILSQFNLAQRISSIEAGIESLNREFQIRTTDKKDEPYWFSQRKRIAELKDLAISMIRSINDEKSYFDAHLIYLNLMVEFSKLIGEEPWFEQSRLAVDKLKEHFQTGLEDALKKASVVSQIVEDHGLDIVEAFLRCDDLLYYDNNFETAIIRKWLNTGEVPVGFDEEHLKILVMKTTGKTRRLVMPLLNLYNSKSVEEHRNNIHSMWIKKSSLDAKQDS